MIELRAEWGRHDRDWEAVEKKKPGWLEHQKRNRRVSVEQERRWDDGLIACVSDSLAYRKALTPKARLEEQALSNRLIEDWLAQQ